MKRTIGLLAALLVMWLSVPASAQTPGWFSRVNIGSTTGTYCTILRGAGSPEGVVTGGVCDVYLRTDGAAGTVIYVKESGTGNTGWKGVNAIGSLAGAGAAGTFPRSNGTNFVSSTLALPDTATANQVVRAVATNTYGQDGDLTFDGVTLQASSATGSAAPVPTVMAVRSSTTASDWVGSTWAALDFVTNDVSGHGTGTRARVGAQMEQASGGSTRMVLQVATAPSALTSVLTLRSSLAADFAGNISAAGALDVTGTTTLRDDAQIRTAVTDTDGRVLTFHNTDTSVSANQGIGRISFTGADASAGSAGERAYIYALTTGATAAGDIAFGVALGAQPVGEVMRLTSTGRLGLGSTNPIAKLETTLEAADNVTRVWTATNTVAQGSFLQLERTRGTLASPEPLQADDLIGQVQAVGWDSARRVGAAIQFHADAEWFTGGDTTDAPGRISFWTVPDTGSALVERLRITNAGQILTGGATQTSGAGAGDLVLPNNTGEIRAVNAAGTNTYPLIGSNASNQVSIASGGAATILGGTLSVPGDVTQDAVLLISSTAPTIGSGFGTSPSVAGARTAAFTVNVGTGGTASSGVLTMPTATTGWNCHVENRTAVAANAADQRTVQTATTTTSVTVQNQTISTGAALAWTASDVLAFLCMAY
jgi:hypothetical protein